MPDVALDPERWTKDFELRTREIEVKEREQAAREREVELAARRERSERWRNPLTVAVFAAAVAGFSNAYIAIQNNRAQVEAIDRKAKADRDLEEVRAEAQRILEMVKTGDPAQAAVNLHFLVQLGLVRSHGLKGRIENWRTRPDQAVAYLPAASDVAEFQRESGMPADGIMGPLTRARMEESRRLAREAAE